MANILERAKELGAWGHSYEVEPGIWLGNETHLNWRVGAFQEHLSALGIDVSKSRILDLACLDGLFCVEYGKLGADIVGVDIRPENIARARFGAEAAGVSTATFIVSDVLDLNVDALGQFDIVLCCGLFYHLTAADALKLIKIMRSLTRGVCVLDTHISFASHIIGEAYPLTEITQIGIDGQTYEGRLYVEFAEDTPMEKRMAMVSSSVENDKSFWFTKDSLIKALATNGFAVKKVFLPNPNIPLEEQGRPVFVLT